MKILSKGSEPCKVENCKGRIMFLHSKEVTLRGGRKQWIFFFSRVEKDEKSGAAVPLPENKMVKENEKSGFLVCKNK